MPNRLARETSPYLQQHADNPVDWYPWGAEALERARREDKPVLVSVGYAACHWCHVMAHESFEDDATAQLMNEHFINVKVDREERPDVDHLYMQAVQAMTGQGGWPMTVFLTPDGAPFVGGTYFPPEDRHGLPSFRRVLLAVSDAYRHRRGSVDEAAARLRELYAEVTEPAAGGRPTTATLEQASRGLAAAYDARHGGFGGAPKFPPSMALEFLLTRWARTGDRAGLEIATNSFLAMARGGVFDQVGGGLHRYSVDARWAVPHFEKMLYDNALFVRLGVHLWQATGDPEIRSAVSATLEWLAREMTAPRGGWYSSLDADSEGEEGTYYVWTPEQLDGVLGADAEVAKAHWGVTSEGNFEGRNVLFRAASPEALAGSLGIGPDRIRAALDRARTALVAAREQRARPARDEKIVAAWNGLMLRAVALAARVFGQDSWGKQAEAAAEFLAAHMVERSRVRRSHRDGLTRPEGFLDDQAAVALGFLEVAALTREPRWIRLAEALADEMVRAFYDAERRTFFDTARDHETLIGRPRDVSDNATPAGTSLAAELLLRLGVMTGRAAWEEIGTRTIAGLADGMERFPTAFGHLLCAADLAVHGAIELVIAGNPAARETASLLEAASRDYLPSLVLVVGDEAMLAGLAIADGKRALGGPTGYVCRRAVCERPTQDPDVLRDELAKAWRLSGGPAATGGVG